MLMALLGGAIACAQRAPISPQQPWQGTTNLPSPASRSAPAFSPDPTKIYTLPELVNLAEQNNPETRVAWENAKARAADLGVSKATLYPTVAAVVAQSARDNLFFAPNYYRQTVETFSPGLEVDYIIFDFGRRLQEIAVSRSQSAGRQLPLQRHPSQSNFPGDGGLLSRARMPKGRRMRPRPI